MLVISRKISETILIGDNIIITVSDIRGQRVRIGVEAPKNIRIIRDDVAGGKEAIEAAREQLASV